jgi:hypothetical protein
VSCASPPAPSAPAIAGFAKSAAPEASVAGEPLAATVSVSATAEGLEVSSAENGEERALRSELVRNGLPLAAAVHGLSTEGGELRWEWLAALSRDPEAELSVLSIHAGDGTLVHEEVLLEPCETLAWAGAGAPELRVGCREHVWSYQPGSGGEPVLTGAEFLRAGNAFGPLDFGESRASVFAALRLAGGSCRTDSCALWSLQLGERNYAVSPGFDGSHLAFVTVFGPRRTRAEWRSKVRADWTALTGEIARGTEPDTENFPPLRALEPSAKLHGWLLTETHHAQGRGMQATVGLYGDQDGKGVGAIAVIAPAAAAAPVPASAAD